LENGESSNNYWNIKNKHLPALAGENLHILIFLGEVNLAAVDIVERHGGARPVDLNFKIFRVDGFDGRQHTSWGG
jgi:hypothetical protein